MQQSNRATEQQSNRATEQQSNRATINIAIIGMGVRGISILERLVAFARFSNDIPNINVSVFDAQPFGSGCHSAAQPEHLLVNTVASQMTMFSDHTVQGSGYTLKGPTFYDWLYEHSNLDSIDPNGYYPRKLLGEYLEWGFNYLCQLAQGVVNIKTISQQVVSLKPCQYQSSSVWRLHTQNGDEHKADYVFITTGHETSTFEFGQPTPSYPLKQATVHIKPSESVAIEGMGLSMCDVLSALTVERGGYFTQHEGNELTYTPSGKEPNILAYSRTGLPLSARASNQKELREQYKPHFLTHQAIKQLKNKHGQLDFDAHIMPLLLRDMEFAYSFAFVKKHLGIQKSCLFANSYLTSLNPVQVIEEYIPIEQRFNWGKLVNPIHQEILTSQEQFKDWLITHIKEDIAQAQEGNLSNPVKAACDVLRDLRDNIRYAIDFSGLTPESHQRLFDEFVPAMNRLAVGPPLRRSQEILALIKAGVLAIDLGPGIKRKQQSTQ